MLAESHHSTATLARLAFRLAVVLVFGIAWPGELPARAAGILCLVLAVGCVGGYCHVAIGLAINDLQP